MRFSVPERPKIDSSWGFVSDFIGGSALRTPSWICEKKPRKGNGKMGENKEREREGKRKEGRGREGRGNLLQWLSGE